jgi:hypothetical protein
MIRSFVNAAHGVFKKSMTAVYQTKRLKEQRRRTK